MGQNKLLAILKSIKAKDNFCEDVYCSTCGGLSSALTENMTPELDSEIRLYISLLSFDEFISLGDWGQFLSRNFALEVSQIILSEENNRLNDIQETIDNTTSNVNIYYIMKLDEYLFTMRRYSTKNYIKWLKIGINAAIESENSSLIETLAIVLGKNLINEKRLFALTMTKYREHQNIHRILYTQFRNEFPELRGYVGDGSSVPYF